MEMLHQPEDIVGDRYRIITPLGQGGVGTTYEAEDLTNYQRVAIKALSLRQIKEWKVLELFEREAKVLANIKHPGIPKYLNYFYVDTESDRRFYLVQELVSGYSLAYWMQQGLRFDETQVKLIAIKLLKILKYLHCLKPPVIHRDIKPQNIILRQDGQVFIVDFGAVQDVYRYTISRSGTFVGTLGFMPPEQLKGQVFPASDLYSLGATLLFLLTHRWPDEFPQRRMKIDFRSVMQVSDKFANWLEKMIEPLVEDRFYSASKALLALQINEKRATRTLATDSVTGWQTLPISNQRSKQIIHPSINYVFMKKTNESLIIKMVHPGSCVCLIGWLVFGMMSISSVAFTFEFIRGALTIGPLATIYLFSIVFILFSLTLIEQGYQRREYLEIGVKTCRHRWQGVLFKGQVEWETQDIERVEVQIKQELDGVKEIKFVIWEGVYPRYFNWYLSQEENESIVAEISKFLKQIQ